MGSYIRGANIELACRHQWNRQASSNRLGGVDIFHHLVDTIILLLPNPNATNLEEALCTEVRNFSLDEFASLPGKDRCCLSRRK